MKHIEFEHMILSNFNKEHTGLTGNLQGTQNRPISPRRSTGPSSFQCDDKEQGRTQDFILTEAKTLPLFCHPFTFPSPSPFPFSFSPITSPPAPCPSCLPFSSLPSPCSFFLFPHSLQAPPPPLLSPPLLGPNPFNPGVWGVL